MKEFLDHGTCSYQEAELFAMMLESHCAATGRADSASRAWRRATFASSAIAILAISLSLWTSGILTAPLAFAFAVLSYFGLFSAFVLMMSRWR
jgi:fatty acid desaturase